MRARAAAPVAFAAVLLPRLAEACPMCASQQPGGVARILALGLMLLVPFSIAFFVFRALRGASGPGADVTSRSSAATGTSGTRASAMREPSP